MSENNPNIPSDPNQPPAQDPYAQPGAQQPPAQDPYAQPGANQPPAQPYGQQQPPAQDPYAQPGAQQPYGQPGAQQPYAQQPPAQPYGQPGSTGYGPAGGEIDVMDAFKYGWEKFKTNAGTLIGGVVIYLVGIIVLVGIFFAIFIASASSGSTVASSLGGFSFLLVMGVALLLGVFMQAMLLRVCLDLSAGRSVSIGSFFQFKGMGNVLLAALLIGVASFLGSLIAVGAIIVAFFAQYALLFVLDKGMSAIDGIKASVDLAMKNLGTSVLLLVGVYVVTAIGSFLCGVGVIVALPIAMLATTFVYRRLQGEHVSA